jgi:hypothetical protein
VDDLRDARDALLFERDALRAESERLLVALTHYGRHELLCSFFKDGPHQASPETICDCGLVGASQTQKMVSVDKPEQPLPDEWVRVFDDMVRVQQRTEAERDATADLLRQARAEVERLRQGMTQ